MKKITLFILLFLSIVIFAFPESESKTAASSKTTKAKSAKAKKKKSAKKDSKEKKTPMRRTFEIGLANVSLGVINDFLSVDDMLKETIIVDLDKIQDSLNIGYNLCVSPIYININVKEKWGLGLSTKIDATGNFVFPGNMMSLKQAVDEKAEVNAAVFAEAGISWFFTLDKLKIKVKPSIFYPVVYLNSDDIYYNNNNDGLSISYNAKLFTAWDEFHNITASPGFDLYAGIEFPFAKALGISKIPLLDFGIGVDIYGINLTEATIKNYSEYSGLIGSDKIDVFGDEGGQGGLGEGFFEMGLDDPVYGMEDKIVSRPFRVQAWLDWRPLFGSRLLTIYPMAGFSINPLYEEPFSKEYGIKARLDISNIFIAELSIKQEDRLWQDSITIILNLRLIELDLGVSVKSPEFIKDLSVGGVGANFGLKIGW
jgi:hypothetical protein